MCAAADRVTTAALVDHIVPHKGNWTLFKDPDNLQSLCRIHHDVKHSMEMGGSGRMPIGNDGWPRGDGRG